MKMLAEHYTNELEDQLHNSHLYFKKHKTKHFSFNMWSYQQAA